LRLFFKEEWLDLRRRAERELGSLYTADESPLVHWLGLLQESYRLLGYFDVAPWVKVWAVFFLEGLVSRINHELDKADSALGRLPVESRRASKANLTQVVPRMFPAEMDLALRSLAQRGGTPSSHASRRRIRAAHAKCQGLNEIGGLFAEVRSLASVTVNDRPVRAELVRANGGSEGGIDEIEAARGVEVCLESSQGSVCVGVLRPGAKQFVLAAPLVPLGENTLSQQDRRRGVRAFGETATGEQVVVVLAVTETAFCYPPGQRLSVAPNNIAPLRFGMRLHIVTVNECNERTGNYSVTYDNMQANAFEDTEVDPFEGNHLVAPSHFYAESMKLTVLNREAGGGFVDVVVAKRPPKEGSVRHLLQLEEPGPEKTFYLDLNDFNHARRHIRLNKEANFEEARRYRVFAKAKNSFIYTVTSERADVLEGPVPRLADQAGREAFFWSEVQALIAEDDERLSSHIFFQGTLILGEHGSGKSCLLSKLAMHCLSHSTLLLPVRIPVLEVCSRLQKAEETGAVDETGIDDAEGLVEWYLRIVYGGDTNRFFMLRQAMECHRLLFLFDGIDEAGPLTPRMERCITGLVAQNHRVVATARLQDEASERQSPRDRHAPRWGNHLYPSWLTTAPQLFRVFELLPLELECRRSLVEVLLGRESSLSCDDLQTATDFVEDFIMHLDEDEGRKWSTPMMVSMLIASWREKKRQDERRARKATGDAWNCRTSLRQLTPTSLPATPTPGAWPVDAPPTPSSMPMMASRISRGILASGVDVREVYRVALDLLLRRFQARRQADRHKIKDTVQKFKELLVLIAVEMAPGTKEFTEENVLPLLERYDIDLQVWKDLSEAIREGRVPLLHAKTDSQDGNTVHFTFTYGSFQRFLSSARSSTRSLFRSSTSNLGSLAVAGFSSEANNSTQEDTLQRALSQALSTRHLSMHLAQGNFFWTLLSGWACCLGQRNADLIDRAPGQIVFADEPRAASPRRTRMTSKS